MFKLKPSDRLNHWKAFRHMLDTVSFDDALHKTVNLWQSCPFTPYYLDPDCVDNWPDPWQLLIENYYCDLARCLGMLYTLHLTTHGEILLPEIRSYYDSKQKHVYHIAWLQGGKYVLNLIEGEVVNKEHINQDLKLKRRYTAADLRLEQY